MRSVLERGEVQINDDTTARCLRFEAILVWYNGDGPVRMADASLLRVLIMKATSIRGEAAGSGGRVAITWNSRMCYVTLICIGRVSGTPEILDAILKFIASLSEASLI